MAPRHRGAGGKSASETRLRFPARQVTPVSRRDHNEQGTPGGTCLSPISGLLRCRHSARSVRSTQYPPGASSGACRGRFTNRGRNCRPAAQVLKGLGTPDRMNLGNGAKLFRSRAPDAQLSIREYYETAREGIESFVLNDRANTTHECVGTRFTQTHKQKPRVRSRHEPTPVREIQILSDQESAFTLCGAPDIAVRPSLESLGRDGVHVVPQSRQHTSKSNGNVLVELNLHIFMQVRGQEELASPPPRKLPRTQ